MAAQLGATEKALMAGAPVPRETPPPDLNLAQQATMEAARERALKYAYSEGTLTVFGPDPLLLRVDAAGTIKMNTPGRVDRVSYNVALHHMDEWHRSEHHVRERAQALRRFVATARPIAYTACDWQIEGDPFWRVYVVVGSTNANITPHLAAVARGRLARPENLVLPVDGGPAWIAGLLKAVDGRQWRVKAL